MAELFQRCVDDIEERRGRAEAAVQRQVAEGLFRRLCQGEEFGPGIGVIVRAGALEAEDRLLEVADGEQGPVAIGIGAEPGKKLAGQRADNVPLREIGILRLVDQDVIGALVELVADPGRHIAFLQQPGGHPDHVVKVDHAVQPLGVAVAIVEGAASFQGTGKKVGIFEKRRLFEQAVAPFEQRSGDEIIVRQSLQQALGRLRRRAGGLGRPGEMDVRQGSGPLLGFQVQPEADRQLPFLFLLAAEFRHRIAQQLDRAQVYRFVGAAIRQPGHRIAVDRQSQQLAHKRQHAAWQPFHRIGLGGAVHQELFGGFLAHPHAQLLDRADDLGTAAPLLLEQQVAERLARQNLLVALLDRLEHRGDTGFFREGSEQRLAEAVDGHDPQAPALRIEDLGK